VGTAVLKECDSKTAEVYQGRIQRGIKGFIPQKWDLTTDEEYMLQN